MSQFTVEFFVHNPFYITINADSREQAEQRASAILNHPEELARAISEYIETNEIVNSEYSFGTTLTEA